MTENNLLPDDCLNFLKILFVKTNGSIAGQASMYDTGQIAGFDKTASGKIAQELMSYGLIDIRTLSGGIGFTAEGMTEAQKLFADQSGDAGSGITLGNQLIINPKTDAVISDILNSLKANAGKMGLNFEDLSELMADIQTVVAQLRSPKPKTAILRECFRSMMPILVNSDETRELSRIKSLLLSE